MKRLTDSNTAEAPVTPSSSADLDQAVARREEGMATAKAKQSSVELQARGSVVVSLSDQPTLRDVVCFAVPRVAPKWYDLGLALDVQPFVLDTISQQQRCPDQPRTMFVRWLEGSPGTGSQPRTWQSVLATVEMICGSAAMEDIRTAVQTPRIPTAGDLEGSKTTEHSSAIELTRKRHRSSTQSSEECELHQSVAKKSLPDYTTIKMDLLAQDISDLHFASDPKVIIKLLYGNAIATISDLLEPHLKAVKKAAGRFYRLGLHHVAVVEDTIQSADSIDSLMSRLSVGGMWDQTHFLRKAVASIPHSAPEKGIAETILEHYHLHLGIFERSTLLKDALTKESESEEDVEVPTEANKLVPLQITSPKVLDKFSCEDCHILQVQGLKKAYGIPEEKTICCNGEERHSTTVTFMVPCQYVHNVIQHSGRLDTVWILLELAIIEVSIPGVFTFIPSVGCFLSLLRGSKPFTADLLGVTEVLPYQTYCLLDPNTKEPLSGRPLSTKMIEQHCDSHGGLVPDPHRSALESGDIVILATHSEEAVIPPEGSNLDTTDEDKVKDLERKVANLFMDNVALKTKLEAIQNVERQHQEEITRLKERLVAPLRAQDTGTQELSLSRTRESELKEKIKVLEEARSDLEAEVEKHEKQMKQLEILPSDFEQLTKQLAAKEAECRQKDESNREKDEVIREKSAAIRVQQAEIQQLRDQLAMFQKAVVKRQHTLQRVGSGGIPSSQAGAEVAVVHLCWIPFGIQSQSIGPEGGRLSLVPSAGAMRGGEGGTILLEVPPSAVSPTENVEVRSALIPDGPFTLPEGYQFGSMVVYLYYDGRRLTKPFTLSLPHWYGGEDHVRDGLSFAMAHHTLKEGQSVYHFELLEGGRFAEQQQCGVLEISGHCTFFAAVFKVEASSLYYASLWTHQVDGAVISDNEMHSKVVITYATPVWLEVLEEYWKEWKMNKGTNIVPVKFKFPDSKKVQGKLSSQFGDGWEATLMGAHMVCSDEVAYGRRKKRDKEKLESEVLMHIYPPAIPFVVKYDSLPDCSRGVKMEKLIIKDTSKGSIPFPFKVYQVKTSHPPSSPSASPSSSIGGRPTLLFPMDTDEIVLPSLMSSDSPSNASPLPRPQAPGPEAGQPVEKRVLMECQTRFFKVVAVKVIYRELCQKKVIPQTVADIITKSQSVEDAQGHLFDHMRVYGTFDTLKVFCNVISSEEYDGFQAMQDFGAEMKRRLEQEDEQTH